MTDRSAEETLITLFTQSLETQQVLEHYTHTGQRSQNQKSCLLITP